MKITKLFLTAAIVAILAIPAHSAEIPGAKETSVFSKASVPNNGSAAPVSIGVILPSTKFEAGKSYPILLKVVIEADYHTNSREPLMEGLIPAKALFSVSDDRVTIGRVTYPKEELKKFSFAEDKLSVYEGTVYIGTTLTFAEGVSEPVTVTATLDYQACTDKVCLLPMHAEESAVVEIGTGGASINQADFARFAEMKETEKTVGFADKLAGASGMGLLFLVFVGGLALNLTPCVYPMIPVTLGYFTSVTGKSRGQTLLHAVSYLLGMAVMYSALGTFAAVTGALFGEMMQNSFVVMFLVLVMIGLSLSMFGFYEIRLPASMMRLSSKTYGGLFGSLFMGLTVGIIAAPCVGPFVIGLLTFVSEKQDPLLGFMLFFLLAVGLGLPLVTLAVFTGSIQSLPRAGEWMVWVRKVFGVILLGMALYFAQPLLPHGLVAPMAAAFVVVGAVYLFIAGKGTGGRIFRVFRMGVPLLMVMAGVLIMQADATEKHGVKFTQYSKQVFEDSISGDRPVVLYFTADWCVPCRELKIHTFGDERVRARAGDFAALKVDLTRINDVKHGLKKEFSVKGVPTVIIFGKDGIEKHRLTGFFPPEKFLKLI